MPIISLRNIVLGHSSLPLIENGNLTIESGERVCLIGRNGVGKSTLLKLINRDIQPDSGFIDRVSSLKIALLPQDMPCSMPGTVTDIVTQSAAQTIEEKWQIQHEVAKILSKLQIDGDHLFDHLSGGIKRRVLLASIIVNEPDILLLDEPTNHLDIEAINILENILMNFQKTIIFVTHDRILMQNLATHIVEIDNGQLISWRGRYQDYIKHKQTSLEAEARANALFDKKLAQEEQWIRQGIKARRTRNEGRVRMLKKMREERYSRRMRPGQVNMGQSNIELSGKIVFEVNNVSYAYDDTPIIEKFSSIILRGDKVGIMGPNGSGKSTLLNLLLGNLHPQEGDIKLGTKLTIGYFDQNRLQLDENKTVIDNIYEGEMITIDDKKVHIITYLQDFLFSPERSRTLVKNLSGGERNRVMLAKLFSKPCNILVLDEPTNDLDVETLELLEEQLISYQGTILLVSHDRAFLNNVVTSTLVIEKEGHVGEYVGGYDDWLRQRKQTQITETKGVDDKQKSKQAIRKSAKLSYNEERELKSLPQKIETLELQQKQLHTKLNDPNFYKEGTDQVVLLNKELEDIEKSIALAYKRWEELDQKVAKS